MSDDNPFAEPSDGPLEPDRTVIRPVPGGVRPPPSVTQRRVPASPFDARPVQPAPAAAPGPSAAAVPVEGVEIVSFGPNPLVTAAAPLLQLLGRLRTTYRPPNVEDLRARTWREVQLFQSAIRNSDAYRENYFVPCYVLCASIDDVAQNTDWGGNGVWAARPLVTALGVMRGYEGVSSGVAFYQLLESVKQSVGTQLDLLELMYLCLSLGFQGRYRSDGNRRGQGEQGGRLEAIREDVYAVIKRQRQAYDPALSPHWQGADAPYKPARAVVPNWVMGVGALALIGALFVWFSAGLNAASDNAFGQMLGAPLSHMPAIQRIAPVHPLARPPAPQPDPLYVFLKPEIDQGLVTVLGDHAMPIVRIRNAGLFASGSAVVAPAYVHLLERIGEALKREQGPVDVVGYTDNQPIHTVQFPSNYQLSKSRAEAARAIIVRVLGDPARVTAEGRADADPIASNATPAGREENRRIEVTLRRQG